MCYKQAAQLFKTRHTHTQLFTMTPRLFDQRDPDENLAYCSDHVSLGCARLSPIHKLRIQGSCSFSERNGLLLVLEERSEIHTHTHVI